MRLSITRRQRSLLFFLSASGYIASFAGVGARIDAQDVAGPSVHAIAFSSAPVPPPVAGQIHRDPFEGAPKSQAPVASEPGAAPVPIGVQSLPSDRGDAGGDTVPDIAGPGDVAMNGSPQGVPMTLVVRATIVGKHSVAYVANGAEMDIVRVGDSLGERRVRAIDLEGIAFTDGSRLDLTQSYSATAAPKPTHPDSIALRIDQLRKIFARRPDVQRPAAATTPATQQPAQAPVTPAPIRTTDSAGLAPGTNPTPDLTGPTAYPYPYPYPAARR